MTRTNVLVPPGFVTSTQGILGQKGKGKSYVAGVQAEDLLDEGYQVVVLDPTGAWFGLRSSSNGKERGYPIAVLGGEHADVPLEATAGEVIADAIATEHFSAVIDLTLFRKGEALRFCAAFLETLYRRNREALHLFIDEADVVAPQKTFSPEQARALGASEDIVRRGRIRGIGCTLITQRPQVLNKDVLSQVDMLTTLGMNHPKDLGAIGDWVAVHGDAKQAEKMIASLPSLPRGKAWVWAPAVNVFELADVRAKRTFDSGRTPKAGERIAAPKVLAEVDIARLGVAIAATVERAKADDPKALRARVAELEKQLHGKTIAHLEIKTIEKPVLSAAELNRLDNAILQAEALRGELAHVLVDLRAALVQVRETAKRQELSSNERRQLARQTFAADGKVPVRVGKYEIRAKPKTAERLPIGEELTLEALIQYPDGLRREQLTVLTSYKRSTRDAYIARLRDRGFVDTSGDRVVVTQAGVDALPNAKPLPTGYKLREWYEERLPAGERAVLEMLVSSYPNALKREDIDEPTGFKRSTRDAYLSRLAAKELVTEPQRGYVRASDTLFDAGEVP